MVAKSGDPSKAAICSKRSAELYGLEILAEAINSNVNNTTRFVVVSPKMELREGRIRSVPVSASHIRAVPSTRF